MAVQQIGAGTNGVLHMVGFTVGNEEFCVDILKVQEIIRMVEITLMPNAPDYVEGVINLRGKVIPVIDFRKRFHLMEGAEIDSQSKRIVVVALHGVTIGIIVDKVSQVIKLSEEQISPTPDAVKGFDSDCIQGVGRLTDKLLIILDLEKLFAQNMLEGVEMAA
ncbi:chemotaxis protein CheW [Geobacter sp. DSM 9736]|uniref:chemotaxis protein CheW n=1 Tax=Geobacter sp. DSM 9736 TaxID=1277350 RepID=UPI000B512912|nr:chemotaxis protein CheW [Geobacter sp. DSM 9736]SNB46152.1 CheW protein [Geobacter sp. DSM 9736]